MLFSFWVIPGFGQNLLLEGAGTICGTKNWIWNWHMQNNKPTSYDISLSPPPEKNTFTIFPFKPWPITLLLFAMSL